MRHSKPPWHSVYFVIVIVLLVILLQDIHEGQIEHAVLYLIFTLVYNAIRTIYYAHFACFMNG
jgi:hypothetical protein